MPSTATRTRVDYVPNTNQMVQEFVVVIVQHCKQTTTMVFIQFVQVLQKVLLIACSGKECVCICKTTLSSSTTKLLLLGRIAVLR